MEDSTQGRRWILTINNPNQTDEEFEKYIKSLEHFKYAMFQREKGHETGTEHFQVFIIFKIGKRFKTIKNYFPTAHIEKANGSSVQCREYCSKIDTRVSGPYSIGEFAEERSRTDLKTLIELISTGVDNHTIKELFPNLYFKNIDKIERMRMEELAYKYQDVLRDVEVTYIYGDSGIGKTYSILKKHGLRNVYRITDYFRDPWFFYKGQDVVVFEEFRGQFKIYDMLNYLDIYPLLLPARYTNKVACFTKIYITTNIPLEKQYKQVQDDEPDTWQALMRRIHKVYKLDKNGMHEINKTKQ